MNSWLLGAAVKGRVRVTIAAGKAGVRRMTGFLALEDGTVFRGDSVAANGFAVGEAVFTTAMTGYQEIVTDPSFAEQLVSSTARWSELRVAEVDPIGPRTRGRC